MSGWITALALYLLGMIALHAMGRDLNGGHWQTWKPYAALLIWPVAIAFGVVGDCYDWLRGQR